MATGCLWHSLFPVRTIPGNIPRACVFSVEHFIGNTVAFPRTIQVCPEEHWGVPSGMLSCSQRNVPAVPTFERLPYIYMSIPSKSLKIIKFNKILSKSFLSEVGTASIILRNYAVWSVFILQKEKQLL